MIVVINVGQIGIRELGIVPVVVMLSDEIVKLKKPYE
jgi:hypothetical protein